MIIRPGVFAGPSHTRPLIALDVDGVLNPHEWDAVAESNLIDRDKVLILNRIILETGAVVVLSSAWRYLVGRADMTIDGLDWLLRSHGVVAHSVAGITHPDTPVEWDEERGIPTRFMENERAKQVSRFRAKSEQHGLYVVIDDMDMGFTAAGQPFVQTNGKAGLTDADADRAIAVLRGDS